MAGIGEMLAGLLGGPQYQSMGGKLMRDDGSINYGDNANPADYFRADRAQRAGAQPQQAQAAPPARRATGPNSPAVVAPAPLAAAALPAFTGVAPAQQAFAPGALPPLVEQAGQPPGYNSLAALRMGPIQPSAPGVPMGNRPMIAGSAGIVPYDFNTGFTSAMPMPPVGGMSPLVEMATRDFGRGNTLVGINRPPVEPSGPAMRTPEMLTPEAGRDERTVPRTYVPRYRNPPPFDSSQAPVSLINIPGPLLANYDWRNARYQNPPSYAERTRR